jgi:elongator complex protein 1
MYAKAMLAYERALEWQDLFDIALQQQMSIEDLKATAYRVAGMLHFVALFVDWITH